MAHYAASGERKPVLPRALHQPDICMPPLIGIYIMKSDVYSKVNSVPREMLRRAAVLNYNERNGH